VDADRRVGTVTNSLDGITHALITGATFAWL
jgi:hypothetical protein